MNANAMTITQARDALRAREILDELPRLTH